MIGSQNGLTSGFSLGSTEAGKLGSPRSARKGARRIEQQSKPLESLSQPEAAGTQPGLQSGNSYQQGGGIAGVFTTRAADLNRLFTAQLPAQETSGSGSGAGTGNRHQQEVQGMKANIGASFQASLGSGTSTAGATAQTTTSIPQIFGGFSLGVAQCVSKQPPIPSSASKARKHARPVSAQLFTTRAHEPVTTPQPTHSSFINLNASTPSLIPGVSTPFNVQGFAPSPIPAGAGAAGAGNTVPNSAGFAPMEITPPGSATSAQSAFFAPSPLPASATPTSNPAPALTATAPAQPTMPFVFGQSTAPTQPNTQLASKPVDVPFAFGAASGSGFSSTASTAAASCTMPSAQGLSSSSSSQPSRSATADAFQAVKKAFAQAVATSLPADIVPTKDSGPKATPAFGVAAGRGCAGTGMPSWVSASAAGNISAGQAAGQPAAPVMGPTTAAVYSLLGMKANNQPAAAAAAAATTAVSTTTSPPAAGPIQPPASPLLFVFGAGTAAAPATHTSFTFHTDASSAGKAAPFQHTSGVQAAGSSIAHGAAPSGTNTATPASSSQASFPYSFGSSVPAMAGATAPFGTAVFTSLAGQGATGASRVPSGFEYIAQPATVLGAAAAAGQAPSAAAAPISVPFVFGQAAQASKAAPAPAPVAAAAPIFVEPSFVFGAHQPAAAAAAASTASITPVRPAARVREKGSAKKFRSPAVKPAAISTAAAAAGGGAAGSRTVPVAWAAASSTTTSTAAAGQAAQAAAGKRNYSRDTTTATAAAAPASHAMPSAGNRWAEPSLQQPTAATAPPAMRSTAAAFAAAAHPSTSSAHTAAPAFTAAPSTNSAVASNATIQALAAEAARLRELSEKYKKSGNSHYEKGCFAPAEEMYTSALGALAQVQALVVRPELAGAGLFPTLQLELAVLYSNRSGARLMIGRPQAGLEDAHKAIKLDPKFFRAVSRAATCFCRLGEYDAARRHLESTLDRMSASSQHFKDLYNKMLEVQAHTAAAQRAALALAVGRASGDRDKMVEARGMVDAIKDSVLYCEVMCAMRAAVGLALGQPVEAVEAVKGHVEAAEALALVPWRIWVIAQARYIEGDFPAALEAAAQLQHVLTASPEAAALASAAGPLPGTTPPATGADAYCVRAHVPLPPVGSLVALIGTLKELQKLKEEGNEAVRGKKYQQAVDKYTAALSQPCCPAYAAVLHCNRAAAHQGLGNVADAVADCGRAKALDPAYCKAYSRLAALMSELRRPDNAQGLLDAVNKSAGLVKCLSSSEKSALSERLAEAKAAISWQKTPEHYKLLGLPRTCTEDEVRKAYRKLALKFHPDKALTTCKVTFRLPGAAGEVGACMLGGSDVEARVRKEAARLFNLINQAHEELADAAKRRKVDQLLDVEEAPKPRAYGYNGYDPFGRSRAGPSNYSRSYGGFGGPGYQPPTSSYGATYGTAYSAYGAGGAPHGGYGARTSNAPNAQRTAGTGSGTGASRSAGGGAAGGAAGGTKTGTGAYGAGTGTGTGGGAARGAAAGGGKRAGGKGGAHGEKFWWQQHSDSEDSDGGYY